MLCISLYLIAWPLSEQHLQVFEKGNFAGLAEMKRNPRLFERVAPMGVNDIIMAVSYHHDSQPPLALPISSFEGQTDTTIDSWEHATMVYIYHRPISQHPS